MRFLTSKVCKNSQDLEKVLEIVINLYNIPRILFLIYINVSRVNIN